MDETIMALASACHPYKITYATLFSFDILLYYLRLNNNGVCIYYFERGNTDIINFSLFVDMSLSYLRK